MSPQPSPTRPPHSTSADECPLVTDGGQRFVLVVDDDELADTVSHWIDAQPGWQSITATGGSEAVDEYGPHVDVVFLDRRMPILAGETVLERLREQDGDARIAMLTAVEPHLDIVELDIDMYLTKPVSRTDVVTATAELLERADYVRELRALYSLSSKLAALQSRRSQAELADDERYQRLLDEFERVEKAARDVVENMDTDQFGEYMQLLDGDATLNRP